MLSAELSCWKPGAGLGGGRGAGERRAERLLGAEETHTPVTPRWLCSTLIVGDQPGSSASRREHA